jgi:hypothetical protein
MTTSFEPVAAPPARRSDLQAWQNRLLDRVYPVLLTDGIYVKIGDGQVANRPNLCGHGRQPRRPAGRAAHGGRPRRR